VARRRRPDRDHADDRQHGRDQHHRHDRAADRVPTPFPVSLLPTEDDARRYLHDRLASREWWCVPIVSENALRVVEVVEDRYFPGRTGGFEALILTERIMGVCAAVLVYKRKLPAARLNALLRELGGPPGCEAGGDQDVVVVLDPPAGGARDRSLERTVAFAGWLGGGAT
jgi:hypothetical protein